MHFPSKETDSEKLHDCRPQTEDDTSSVYS